MRQSNKMAEFKSVFLYSVLISTLIGLIVFKILLNGMNFNNNTRIISRIRSGEETDQVVRYVKIPNNDSMLCVECYHDILYSDLNTSQDMVYEYFSGKYLFDKPPLQSMAANKLRFYDDRITVYSDMFAILNDVTMYPRRRQDPDNIAKGGEEIRDVIPVLKNNYKQIFTFNSDLFEMSCKTNTDIKAMQLPWLKNLKLNVKDNAKIDETPFDSAGKHVIIIARGDYANMHNWMRNLYNTFLMMIFFKVQPQNVNIMFMDGHPASELDKAWTVLCGPPSRIGHIQTAKRYEKVILNFMEHQGPVSDFRNKEVPYIEELRSFVLSQFKLPIKTILNCSKIKITIIIRRNSVYHPWNLEGKVGRKIFNEAVFVNDLMKEFPGACVKPVLMESLPMRSQLQVISQSDILIGMHGAGMTHVMFLPQHAAVLEMFSKAFKINRPWYECYNSITKWRGMKYDSWENFDSKLEMPFDFTVLPTDIIVKKTRDLANKICPI